MARRKRSELSKEWKGLIEGDEGFRVVLQGVVQEVLEAQMDEALGAGKWERTDARVGYRSGYYPRTLVTRVGKLELRVPQDRHGRFSTEVFERYQRSEKALVLALGEMYVQGVSTRKVKAITEELCGHEFSASTISRINQGLDEELAKFAERRLEEEYPYVILDARYEKVREEGVIRSQAVLVAIGINWDGRRCVLAVELANRESQTSWKEFLERLRTRGLRGVLFVVSDDHLGLKKAIPGGVAGSGLAALLCAFPTECAGPPAAQSGRRLFDGAAVDLRPAELGGGATGPGGVAGQMGYAVREAVRLGGGEHRGDADFLPAAAAASQAHEIDQHVGAAQRGDQAADVGGANLPKPRQLSSSDPGFGGGDA